VRNALTVDRLSVIPSITPSVVRDYLRSEAWRRGLLRWKLHTDQQSVYDSIHGTDASRFVLEIARRWGKSYLLATIAIETCIRFPGCRVVYGAPTLKLLQEFILPTFEALIEDAPADVKPRWDGSKGHWRFPNGSWVHLFGADDKRKADRGRGPDARLAIFDEAGFSPVLAYVIKSIFKPSLLRTGGRTLLGSTPAEEPDHPFTAMAERAEARGTYARRTIYDNPQLTPERIAAFIADDAKDEGMSVEQYMLSDDFRREHLAERVVNRLLTVVPEWEDARKSCIVAVPQPDAYDAMTVIDWGGADPHAIIFGYWHFKLAKWVIEDELLLRDGQNTKGLVDALQEKERQLWGVELFDGTLRAMHLNEERELLKNVPEWLIDKIEKAAPRQPYARWCDNNNLALARDLAELHGVAVIPTAKNDLQLQVNNLRLMIGAGDVLLHPRCVETDRHLRSTTWHNHKRRDFRRTEGGEHGDLVATCIYGARNLSRRNPYKQGLEGMSMARRAQAEAEMRERSTILPRNNPLTRRLLGR
jgi:hypothetical protein